jgi:hypothetical protein
VLLRDELCEHMFRSYRFVEQMAGELRQSIQTGALNG